MLDSLGAEGGSASVNAGAPHLLAFGDHGTELARAQRSFISDARFGRISRLPAETAY